MRYIDWEYSTRRRLDIADIHKHRGYQYKVTSSEEDIRLFAKSVSQLKPFPEFINVDVRMYCVLYNVDGKRDTLRVGCAHIYQIDNKVYDESNLFIKLLKCLTK